MRTLLLLLVLAGCDSPPADTAPATPPANDTDADADADTDADTDTDVDTDTEPEPPPQAKLRILHVAVGHGPLDMYVNAGASPILNALAVLDGTAWTDRPVGTFDFQFTPAGGAPESPLFELLGYPLDEGTNHTFILHTGLDGALVVLPVVDDATGIAPTDQRIRWTHVAPDLPTFDVVETTSGAVFASQLAWSDTIVDDYAAGPMSIGLDFDGDGAVEHLFESFDLSQSAGAGKMVDLQVVSEDGEPFLIAYQPTGVVARRDLVTQGTPSGTPGTAPVDTAAPDTGP